MSPDELLSIILSRSEKSHLSQLRKVLENSLNSPSVSLVHLEKLNPKKHSLGLVYLLLNLKGKPFFASQVEKLVDGMVVEDIIPCVSRFGELMHEYAAYMRDAEQYIQCLRTLRIAIEKIQPTTEHLTPMHADYLMVCLKAKNFRLAAKLVDQKILDLEPSRTGLTPKDMLLYYYYGGNVLIGLKRFVDAERFYDIGLSVPASIFSAIMVETYKRFVLVQLLNHGKFIGVNSNASNLVRNPMKSICRIYSQFANAFAQNDGTELRSQAKEHEKAFIMDKNLGLINQCIEAFYRRNIKKLTSTYVTLSLSALVQHAHLKNESEATQILLRMIENGEISARISCKDKMVIFLEEQSKTNITERVNSQIDECLSLAKKLKKMDDALISSKLFVSKRMGVSDELFRGREQRSMRRRIF